MKSLLFMCMNISCVILHQVKNVDCYTVTSQELECITAKFNFTSMMRGEILK